MYRCAIVPKWVLSGTPRQQRDSRSDFVRFRFYCRADGQRQGRTLCFRRSNGLPIDQDRRNAKNEERNRCNINGDNGRTSRAVPLLETSPVEPNRCTTRRSFRAASAPRRCFVRIERMIVLSRVVSESDWSVHVQGTSGMRTASPKKSYCPH